VPIGQTLAEARHQAGLTVAEVSERTRIRETIIRAIEDDDYSACGGDFYARGHIRSIAKVVGTDPEPLIREYDTAHRAPGALSAVSLAELLATSEQAPQRRGPDLSAAGGAAASTYSTVRHRLNWIVVLGVALAVALGFGVYRFLASPQQTAVTPSAASNHAATGHYATHTGPNPAPKASAAVAPSPVAPSPAMAAPARGLTPVSVAAFGPGGGDNPQLARQAIGDRPGAGWRTDWYGTARFGNLYGGTGLLLDMGRPVTLTAVQIALGQARGASLQVRVGAAPALANLRSVAHAADTGGVVRLRLTRPARGRYVLIWFTSLPPNPSGTFQAEVWNVRLDGRA